ncbi:FusB/FusC family EF-G-binding protein [Ectobacillus funiculus]|uniref:FusB/FusC family EF-G-binding protein n=1 Tax=Ectobacillus funiculus TaxID=137993 RepID=UPI00397AB68E
MKPFIRSDQYHFIKAQTQILINGHASANDIDVLNALKSLVKEKVLHLFADVSEEQAQLLQPIVNIKNKEDAEVFLSQIKPYVIPFQEITEQTIKKLFPKVKKLKVPLLEHIDEREISYLGWNDQGSNKKYLVAPYHNRLIGLQGTFNIINQKGICALCNRHGEVGMFMSKTKGSGIDTFTTRGNYICQDSYTCNHNLTTLDKLHDFIERLQ